MKKAKAALSRRRNWLPALCSLLLIACDIPRDPEHSWQEATEQVLRVGQVARGSSDRSHALERRIIEGFASEHGLQVRFVEGSESELVKRLEHFDLHLAFGGFDKETVWGKKVGMSASYDGKHVFLVPRGENRLLYEFEAYVFKWKPGS